MRKSLIMSQVDIQQLSNLANLPIHQDDRLKKNLRLALMSTIEYVSQISQADTKATPETHQITELTNVFREDKINSRTTLSQQQASQNATKTHQGYIVVDQVIEV